MMLLSPQAPLLLGEHDAFAFIVQLIFAVSPLIVVGIWLFLYVLKNRRK
jgi:hypothetical protein